MPSPFPGMDPYIEDPEIWNDFHTNLAPEIQGQLNPLVRPKYVARLIPRVAYESLEIAKRQDVRPDLALWRRQPASTGNVGAAVAIPTAPVESSISYELPLRLISVEIYKTENLELVTAIEILSPVNKRRSHEAFHDYLKKRRDLLRSGAHFVEIDLLRGGERPPLEQPVRPAPYYVMVSRTEFRPRVEVWPIQLWDSLPVIPIPLSEPDPAVPLDLSAALNAVYERGGYADLIDYHRSPPPPKFEETDLLWIDKHLREQGVR